MCRSGCRGTLVKPIEGMARLRGATKPPLLTAAQIKFMTLNLDYSIAKAKRVLGYRAARRFSRRHPDCARRSDGQESGGRTASQKRPRFSCEPISPMHIRKLTAFVVRLPLKRSFTHATATRDESENVFVRCELADGTVGWGEGVPRSYVTGETPAGCVEQLAATPVGEQLGGDCNSWADVIRLCEAISAGGDRGRSARLLWQCAAMRGRS